MRTGDALLADALRPYRRTIAAGSALAVAHQVCEALVAVLIGVIIDEAVATGDGRRLAWWLGVLAAVFVVLATSALVGYYLLDRVEQVVAHDVRVRIAQRVLDPGGSLDQPRRPGEVISLAASDAERVGSIANVVAGAVSASVVLVGGGLYLLTTSWVLGSVVLAGLPVVVVVAQRAAGPLRERSEAEQEAVAEASAVAVDLIGGLRVLKGVGAEAAAADRYRLVSRAARDGRIHAAAWLGRADALTTAVSGIFVVVLAWVGGRLALDGRITVGEMVAAVGLAAFLVDPLDRLSMFPAERAIARTSAERIMDVLARPTATADGAVDPAPGPLTLTLRQVHSQTLAGLSLDVHPGEVLGVVAADPRDATALLDLLARRADPRSGAIEYGGVALPAYSLTGLRRAIRVADHDASLFTGTLATSLQTPLGAADGAVLRASGLEELVEAGPAGLETAIGEAGRGLSGGQRQRLALARALAGDPPVLVLHEPTTAVDAVTEHRIAEHLAALRAGRSTVLITSSAALLARCDRVVVIRAGGVVAEGTHRGLVTDDADYRDLVLG